MPKQFVKTKLIKFNLKNLIYLLFDFYTILQFKMIEKFIEKLYNRLLIN